MVTSKRAQARGSTSKDCCCQCPSPRGEPLPTHTSTGDPPTLAGWSAQSPAEPLLLSRCMQNFVCVLQEWSVCFHSPVEILWPNPAGLQSQIPWGFLSLSLDPQVGKPDVQFRTFTTMGELIWYYCYPVCELPTQDYGIWFYCDCIPPPVSLWLLLCLWLGAMIFGGFQYPPVDGCSRASYNFNALIGGDKCTFFYSAILNQFPLYSVLFDLIISFLDVYPNVLNDIYIWAFLQEDSLNQSTVWTLNVSINRSYIQKLFTRVGANC